MLAAVVTAWRYGVSGRGELASRSGLAFPQTILAGELPAPPIGRTMDFAPVAFDPGRAVFEGRPDERHYNPLGGVHGGYAATLLDSCMGCAVQTLLVADEAFTTMQVKVAFLRPLTAGTGRARAIGTALQRGRRAAYAEGRLLGEKDRLLAHGTTTCMVFPIDGPPRDGTRRHAREGGTSKRDGRGGAGVPGQPPRGPSRRRQRRSSVVSAAG